MIKRYIEYRVKDRKGTLRLKKQCVRTDCSVMLNWFNPNQLPTLAWALIGFIGLAFCQQSEVRGREARNEFYT